VLLGALRDATRIARMSHWTVVGISPPFTPSFTAVALVAYVAFASSELVQWGRLACASVHAMLRPRVKGAETAVGAACPRLYS